MSLPAWRRSTWLYYGTVIALGSSAVALSLRTILSARPVDGSWLLLAIPLVLLHRTYIQLPDCDGRICPSGLFVLYAGLAWGPAEATLLAVIDAAFNSLQQSSLRLTRLLFNLAVLPLAIFLATHAGEMLRETDFSPGLELFFRAMGVTLLYYVTNLGLVLAMMALSGGAAAISAARSALLWSWAHYLVGGIAAFVLALWGPEMPVAIAVGAGVLALTCFTLKHYFVVLREREQALRDKERLLIDKEGLLEEVRATHLATLETLALAIEAKDPLTHGHIRRVQKLAEAIGARLGMNREDLDALRIGALLHDIGKLAIPEYLLYRNKKLTLEDESRLRSHARLGADILRNSRLSPQVLAIVRHHHERYDGSGYPYGLVGEDTILGARVLAVADAYDKLRHAQSSESLARDQVMSRIRAESGAGFDPRVVEALCRLTDDELDRAETDGSGAPSHAVASSRPSFVSDFYSSHKEARALYRLIQDIRATPELEPSLRFIARAIGEAVPWAALMIFLPDHGGETLKLAYSEGVATGEAEAWPGPRWLAMVRHAFAGGTLRIDPSMPEVTSELSRHCGAGVNAVSLFPLALSPADSGLVVLCHREDFAYAEEQRRLINLLLKEAGPAIANARYYDRFRRDSLTDALTGLANGRALREQGPRLIAETLRDGGAGGVVVLDLNGFKQVNDTLGHHQGDCLLVQVARVLASRLRRGDLLARNGGDEFVMILPGLPRHAVMSQLESIHAEVCGLWPEGWDRGHIGISAGVAWFPEDGHSLELLMEVADARMYADKRGRKGNVSYLGAAPRARARASAG